MAISPETFRVFYKPHYKRIWGMIKSRWKDRYIFLHSCGNIAPIIPDLIECGLDVLIQFSPRPWTCALRRANTRRISPSGGR